jgi:hypothetical protein
MSAASDRVLSVAADALVAVVFWADRKHVAWSRITDDAPRVP